MSGHSKWANIKQKKGKTDAARGHMFTKIGREIAVAVKTGGPDPDMNSKLRDVITKAKQYNMPNDNITRSIKKASGEAGGADYEEIVYEGYGPGGVAIIVETLTDNRNRTGGEIRHIFDKYGGALGQTGCVGYMFNRRGVIVCDRTISEDDMIMLVLESGAEDLITDEEVFEVFCSPQDLFDVAEKLKELGAIVLSQQLDMIPDMEVTPEGYEATIEKLINTFDESDDVQNVYHNAILPQEDEEE